MLLLWILVLIVGIAWLPVLPWLTKKYQIAVDWSHGVVHREFEYFSGALAQWNGS